jgi:hypothetical protein
MWRREVIMTRKRWTPTHMKMTQAKKITRRMTNYTEVEDEALIRAWDSVTLDGVTGTDQTGKRYWQRI